MKSNFLNFDFRDIQLGKPVDLFVVDPPYGNIISDEYDKIDQNNLMKFLWGMLDWMSEYSYKGTSAYIFGGTGKYKDRPFIRLASCLEEYTKWRIVNWITWAKRKGYGTQRNWMYAREEILFLVYDDKYPKYFNVPYRDEERSEAWKKRLSKQTDKHPKSNKLRYSNVIYDINELFRNKFVTAEKPETLYKLLIETSCPQDGYVVDPMCGSGTTGAVVKKHFPEMFCTCIEKDENVFDIAKKRMSEID